MRVAIRVSLFLLGLIALVFFIRCCSYNKVEVSTETTTVETPTIVADTVAIDTTILPPVIINKDSLERAELIRDSIAFRKLVKKINGGYNGFADRYKIWLRARNKLKNQDN